MQLKEWRKAQGLYGKEAAEIFGLAPTTYWDLENLIYQPLPEVMVTIKHGTNFAVTESDHLAAWASRNQSMALKAMEKGRRAVTRLKELQHAKAKKRQVEERAQAKKAEGRKSTKSRSKPRKGADGAQRPKFVRVARAG